MRSKDTYQRGLLPPFGALPAVRENEHKQRNRHLLTALWISLPFIVVMALVGAALVGLQLWSVASQRAAMAENNEQARAGYVRQEQLTAWGLTPWIAQLNLGITANLQADWPQGVVWLEKALETVPQAIPGDTGKLQPFSYECRVRINLATSLEGIGDNQRAEADLAGAEATYTRAIDIVTPCQLDSSGEGEGEGDQQSQSGGQGGTGQVPDEGGDTAKGLEEKRQQVQNEQNGVTPEDSGQATPDETGGESQGQGTEGDPFEGETPAEQARREELEQRNNEQKDSERDTPTQRDPGTKGW